MSDLPRTSEYAEAVQAEVDKERNELIATLPKELQDNFKYLEKVNKELAKRNIPFVLLANPFQYEFENGTHKNFWRWYSLGAGHEAFTKESDAAMMKTSWPLFKMMFGTMGDFFPSVRMVAVGLPDGKVLGVTNPPKKEEGENESGTS